MVLFDKIIFVGTTKSFVGPKDKREGRPQCSFPLLNLSMFGSVNDLFLLDTPRKFQSLPATFPWGPVLHSIYPQMRSIEGSLNLISHFPAVLRKTVFEAFQVDPRLSFPPVTQFLDYHQLCHNFLRCEISLVI